jgi:hypothetical protein
VDRRTDVWSFGCVLYEALTGRKAFEGETVSDTIARILEREPAWSELPGQTPPSARHLLERCLEKESRKRLRDIGDARLELEAALAARASATRAGRIGVEVAARPKLTASSIGLGAVLLVLGAVLGVGLWSTLGPGAARSGRRRRGAGPVRARRAP